MNSKRGLDILQKSTVYKANESCSHCLLTIKVSGDECTNAYESVLAKLVRGAEIPGNYFSTVSRGSEFIQET